MNRSWLFLLLIIPTAALAIGREQHEEYKRNRAYYLNYAYPKLVKMRILKMSQFAEYRAVNSKSEDEFNIYATLSNYLLGAYREVHALSAEGFLIYELISGENYLNGATLCNHEKSEKYKAYMTLAEYSENLFTFALNDLVSYWENFHVK